MSATPLLSASGVGVISRSASSIVAKAASAFHVLRIDGYSQTKTVLPGEHISSTQFTAGNHPWLIDYYPNGAHHATISDFIAIYLKLARPHRYHHHHESEKLPRFQAQYKLSLIDQDGHPSYELPARTFIFGGDDAGVHRGDGYDEFIAREVLEKRGDLLHDDCITVRCDVGVTQVDNRYLAHQDIDGDGSDDEEYSRRKRRPRRRDDKDYVKWCASPQRSQR